MSYFDDEVIADLGLGLSVQEIAELLRQMPVVLRQLILALPSRAAGYHPGPRKWCIKQVLGHLTEEDKRDFVGRVVLMLRLEEPRLDLNDQDAVAHERDDCAKDVMALLDEFAAVRKTSVQFVERLSADDLERTGMHPKIGLIRVRELLHEWLYHDLNHVRQIGQNVQQLMWIQLGNMQGFYKV